MANLEFAREIGQGGTSRKEIGE